MKASKNKFIATLDWHLSQQIRSLDYCRSNTHAENSANLLRECLSTLKNNNSIIMSGLGKNVPICEKFVGTLTSLGLRANFMHTNTAIHGDLGMVHDNDLVIVLSKSGNTSETISLLRLLNDRKCSTWLLTCAKGSKSSKIADKSLVLEIPSEGDPWNLVPNNSTLAFLMYLQSIAMSLIDLYPISHGRFHRNHPGGAIGEKMELKVGDCHSGLETAFVDSVNLVDKIVENNSEVFSKIKLMSFDLDGTLIGSNSFPLLGLKNLRKANIDTTIVSGAGPRSFSRKMVGIKEIKKIDISKLFSLPIVLNEGAIFLKNNASLIKIDPLDICSRVPIEERGISEIIRFILRFRSDVEVFGHYANEEIARQGGKNISSLDYICYIKKSKKRKQFKEKYPKTYFCASLDEYILLLKKGGINKMIVGSKVRAKLEKLQKKLTNKALSSIINEGVLNITSSKANKYKGLCKVIKKNDIKADSGELLHFGNDLNDMVIFKRIKTSVIVDSGKKMTYRLINDLKKSGVARLVIVIKPALLDALLLKIGSVLSQKYKYD